MFKTIIMYALQNPNSFQIENKKVKPRETILTNIVYIKSYRTNQKPSIGLNN